MMIDLLAVQKRERKFSSSKILRRRNGKLPRFFLNWFGEAFGADQKADKYRIW